MSFTHLKITDHMTEDRMDRYIEIQMNTGLGNPVAEQTTWRDGEKRHMIVTDTGVAIITDRRRQYLITMYYMSMEQAKNFFYTETKKIMPQVVYDAIKKNIQRNLTTNSAYSSKRGRNHK